MDEISALRYIFKESLVENKKNFTIEYASVLFNIDKLSMKILDPNHEYTDVYNYILTTNFSKKIDDEKTIVDIEDIPEVNRITEEQFMKWCEQRSNFNKEVEGLSGKQIWLLKKTEYDII